MNKNLLKGLMLFGAFALGSSATAQTYCAVSTAYNFDYLSSVTSVGAVSNISYSASSQPAGSYSDATAQTFESYETQAFTINTSYVGGGNGVNIWVDWNNDGTFDPSELVASEASGAANKTFSVNVPATAALGDYRMRIRSEYGSSANPAPCGVVDHGSTVDFNLTLVNPPTCLAPTALTAANITTTTAELSWTNNSAAATTWNIEYGAPGFALGSGTSVSSVTNPYTATITPGTSYEYYVQADCGGGDLSSWAGPYAFSNTYCLPVYTSTGEYLTVIETVGAIADVSHTASAFPGNGGFTDETAQVLQAYESLVFDLNTAYSYSTSYVVRMWVDWNNDFEFDHATELVSSASGSNAFTQQVTIPVGTPVGSYRVRVRGEWSSSSNPLPCSSETWGSAADFTMQIITPPSCLPPMDIDTLSTTTTSIELEWLELNTGTLSWNIEYGPSGFTPGTPAGTIVPAPTNPFTVTGLTPSTNYDFYVQSVCTTTDQSAWRGPFSVYTACGIAIAPFYEGFNNAVQPQCWENTSSNTTSTSVNNFWKFSGNVEGGALNNGKPNGTFAFSDGDTPKPDSMMLMTPEIDISQLVSPYLSFEWFSNNTNNPGDNIPLIVSVFDGTSWNLLDTLRGDDPEWQFVNYDLSAYSNNIIRVRFMTNQTLITSTAWYNDILLDEVRVDDCVSMGGQDGSVDVCRLDKTIDLNTIIVKPNGGGEWTFPSQPAYIINDSIFNFEFLPAGSYEVYYTERYVCYDTTFATINVFNESSAGNDGTLSVCKNEPINLFGALGGTVDLGGDWYDFSSNLLPNSQPKAQNIPGQYNYSYIVSNGVCPADTAIIEVGVLGSCDFLALGEELFTDISVYPNPATTQLNIVNPSNTSSLKVEMLDMNGRVVLVENKALNNASEATLAIDHLEKGIYTLRVYNNEGQRTFKVVKQ